MPRTSRDEDPRHPADAASRVWRPRSQPGPYESLRPVLRGYDEPAAPTADEETGTTAYFRGPDRDRR